ncbi:MAG: serine peptidase, partial [Caldimonas sp.]
MQIQMARSIAQPPWLRLWFAVLASLLGLAAASAATPVRAQSLPDFTELVEKVGPAVVNIRTTEKVRAGRNGANPELDEDMLEFFRRFGLPTPNRPTPRGSPQAPD